MAAKRPADASEPAAKRNTAGAAVTPELMKVYYERCFPATSMFNWLSYRDSAQKSGDGKEIYEFFARREFSMTLPGDIYVRYKSFDNPDAFRQAITEMQPEKIDIGAVFSFAPKMHQYNVGRDFVPVERELVFDIDMDDYDEIRTCCEKAAVCPKCWRFMSTAIKILNSSLREDFGFEHIMFVFSGRRGVHCWVSDEVARQLPNEQRIAVAEYLSFIAGNSAMAQKVQIWTQRNKGNHPHVDRAIKYCTEALLAPGGILETQEFLLPNRPKMAKVMELLQPEVAKELKTKFEARSDWTSRTAYEELCQTLDKHGRQKLKDELAIEFAYPRLDINVSKQMNHLLKGPFCVHPKTGKVCIPIVPEQADEFNPDNAPTLRGLVDAINAEQTSPLEPHIKFFKRYIDNIVQDIAIARKAEKTTEW